MNGPYLLPEREGGDKTLLQVQEWNDLGEVRQQARVILKQHMPESLEALASAGDDRKRSYEQIKAADQYCAAVVQHTNQIANMPPLLEYIEEVCPKRAANGGGMEGGGSKGKGKEEVDDGSDDDEK